MSTAARLNWLRHRYIYLVLNQNKGYAPGLALGKLGVSLVSLWRLRDLLLVLFNHLLVLLLALDQELHQLVLYMHAMIMQHSILRQQQFLKYTSTKPLN